MSERDGYEPGVPCWIDTWQPDAAAAATFYTTLFGWEAEDTMPPGTPGSHYMCRLRGRDVAAIASRPARAPATAAWNTYVWVESAVEAAANAAWAGGSIVMEPFPSLDGGLIAVVADPAGAVFSVWQPAAHKGAQLVNEPGAWSMSALNTPDPDGAKAFYRDVLGWGTETLDLGTAEVTLWRLPGYVGGEPGQPVPRDLVATMAPTSGDDASPRWSVDFWVDDVDATADRAAQLGGEVVTPPYDIPVAALRQAILADPQAAAFSVTKVTVGEEQS
jgi:predicted enzyme related to lactoylglutathione lyase